MENLYRPEEIEPKWQALWEKQGIFRQYDRTEKFYVLDMFPYPSGAGLHVGHPKGYIATDVLARMKQLQGKAVLHPMGWDAFGLPAEQYAIKNKLHPSVAVKENIDTFKKQLELIGFTYDWEREINTTDPVYYKWTQWIFLQLWKAGLAYESNEPINWCPSCKTGLANEDLEQGKCERCGSEVEKRPLRQWVLAMTKYADRLLEDLDDENLEWSASIKEQQRNWIGRSEGVEIDFLLHFTHDASANDNRGPNGERAQLSVFTTRPDTLYGVTYMVLSPEHLWVTLALRDDHNVLANKEAVRSYVETASKKTEIERTAVTKDKTGVLLEGVEAIHPITGEHIPLYVADYVLAGYGTGVIMAVPGHDERDFLFAKKFNLPIKNVVEECVITEGERDDAYRPEEKTEARNNVAICLYDPKRDAYLAISWKQFEMRGVVTGGIDEGETIEESARREILEETGYKNVQFLGISDTQKHTKFFHRGKKVNRHAIWNFAFFELIDDEQGVISDEDTAQHELVWVKKDAIKNYFTVAEARWAVELFEDKEKNNLVTEEGIIVNSAEFSGLSSIEAREKIGVWLEENKVGLKKVNYRMRDWTFSRQRYWGEPIPLIHCADCGVVGVPESDLPVELPQVDSYEPNDSGESPLANIESWVKVSCPNCGKEGRRETNTMPQWAGSCWYYLRYIDPKNTTQLVDKKKEEKMMPVDVYVGGTEHATRHLLYARFWHKFLFDQGVVSTTEPFKKLVNQGLILASDGRKMSKRWGNVINPDEMVGEFGADAFRVYEMFMGPFTQSIAWNTDGLIGTRRFIDKVWKLQHKVVQEETSPTRSQQEENIVQNSIEKVTSDIEDFKFNTAISTLMILVNFLEKQEKISRETYEVLLLLLSPFAPHMTEELWEKLGKKESIFLSLWPTYNPEKVVIEEVAFMIQINGKIRDQFQSAPDLSNDVIEKEALKREKVKEYTEGKEIQKVIIVPNKLVSIVIS